MTTPRVDSETAAFVLLGNFNPAILQPSWLVERGVVTEAEAETGEDSLLVSPEVTSLLFPDFAIEVLRERLTVITTPSAPAALIARDAAVSILTLLPHTPVHAVGINLTQHVGLAEGGWQELERRYAQPNTFVDVLSEPRLRSVAIEGDRTDGLDGFVRLTIEPSIKVQGGAWLAMNSHVQLTAGLEATKASDAAGVLEEYAEQALAGARVTFGNVTSQ